MTIASGMEIPVDALIRAAVRAIGYETSASRMAPTDASRLCRAPTGTDRRGFMANAPPGSTRQVQAGIEPAQVPGRGTSPGPATLEAPAATGKSGGSRRSRLPSVAGYPRSAPGAVASQDCRGQHGKRDASGPAGRRRSCFASLIRMTAP
ncbi:MAG: hypothetical protein HW391_2027 [Chloroflexi bacterium]|nr:hypothetical protein [Chloroflexota bacterium]